MRAFLAGSFRLLFLLPFFKKRYYGIQQHIIHRFRLFRGIQKTIRLRSGIRINADLDDWIGQQLYFLGEYEGEEMKLMGKILRKGGVFIDIGANIGLFSLHAARAVGKEGRVIAFEPVSKNHSAFLQNISLNGFSHITVEKLAVSNMTEPVQIAWDEKELNMGMASAYLKSFSQSETVFAVTLDSYVKNHDISRVDLIKLDIEGGEFPALEGMEETLKKFRPPIIIEIKENVLNLTPYTKKEILDLLTERGYRQADWKGSEGNYLFTA